MANATTHGIGLVFGLEERGKQFEEMVEEFHSSEISEPIVAESFIALTIKMKVTWKGQQNHPAWMYFAFMKSRKGKS